MRSLKTRLKEYRDNLLLIADQVTMVTEAYPELDSAAKSDLLLVAEHYTILCGDLDRLIKGKELERYVLRVSDVDGQPEVAEEGEL